MNIQERKNILKNISLKREFRTQKKNTLLNKKQIKKKSISIQTDPEEIKNDKKILEIEENIDIDIKKEENKDIYKCLYFSLLLNHKNIEFNQNKECCKYKMNILNNYNEINVNNMIIKELIFTNTENIVLKISIGDEIIINKYSNKKFENITKKILKEKNILISLEKKLSNNILKINNKIELIFESPLNYYFIR